MEDLLNKILEGAIWPFMMLLFVVAIIVFLWGLIEFLVNADNEEKKSIGKRHMIWGVIGLAIMFSVYGIMQIIQSFIGYLGNTSTG